MKQLFVITITFLALFFTGCSVEDKTAVKYPDSFGRLDLNDNIILMVDAAMNTNRFFAFDTAERRRIKAYDFEGYCRLNNVIKYGDNAYAVLSSPTGNGKRIFVKINLPAGDVEKIDFYDEHPTAISIVNDKIWIDSAMGYSEDEHRIQVYNPADGKSETIKSPYYILSSFTAGLNGSYYKFVYRFAGAGSHPKILNCSTMEMYDVSNRFGKSYTSSAGNFCVGKSGDLNYSYIYIRGEEVNGTKESSRLLKVTSIEPSSYSEIIVGTFDDDGHFVHAEEIEGYLYVTTLARTGNDVTVKKLNPANNQLVASVVLPSASALTKYNNKKFWFNGVYNSKIYEVDPETMTFTEW